MVAERKVHCTLVMGKTRMAPTKVVAVLRLKLCVLREELKAWSRVFLDRLPSHPGIYKKWRPAIPCFCCGVQKSRNSTDPGQWFYVEANQNPADHISRGLMMAELMKSNWFIGSKFLWDRELITIQGCPEFIIGDPVRRVLRTILTQRENFLNRLSRLSA